MSIYPIPITKIKGKTINIDTGEDTLPEGMFKALLMLGAKTVLNRAMPKSIDYPTDAEYEAAVFAKVEKNLSDLYSGQTRFPGLSASKGGKAKGGAAMTEALRLAKLDVRAGMKDKGIKVSLVSAGDITKAARAYVEADEEYYMTMARDNLAKSAKPSPKAAGIDLISMLPVNEKKAKAVVEKKSSTKAQAKGKVAKPLAKKGTKPTHVNA